MKSHHWPLLPLQSVIMQQQELVLLSIIHITTRNVVQMSLVWDHVDVQRLLRTELAPHWL